LKAGFGFLPDLYSSSFVLLTEFAGSALFVVLFLMSSARTTVFGPVLTKTLPVPEFEVDFGVAGFANLPDVGELVMLLVDAEI
jgi:hypothetical protein